MCACASERFRFNLLRNAGAHLLARIGSGEPAAGAKGYDLSDCSTDAGQLAQIDLEQVRTHVGGHTRVEAPI